jgi:hypothetical protein
MTAFPNTRYPLPRNIQEVRVLNSDNNTHYYMSVYANRMEQFFAFVLADRKTCLQKINQMPGVAAPATLALEQLFTNVPPRFPLPDMIRWMRQEQKMLCGGEYPNPTITYEELEDALARWVAKGIPDDAPPSDPTVVG